LRLTVVLGMAPLQMTAGRSIAAQRHLARLGLRETSRLTPYGEQHDFGPRSRPGEPEKPLGHPIREPPISTSTTVTVNIKETLPEHNGGNRTNNIYGGQAYLWRFGDTAVDSD
jgi:hypothetical protein